MAISFLCSHCRGALSAGDDQAGRSWTCPLCAAIVEVPVVLPLAVDSEARPAGTHIQAAPALPLRPFPAEETKPDPPSRRLCPACGEWIVLSARLCRFCGVYFNAAGEVVPGGKQFRTLMNVIGCLATAVGIFLLLPVLSFFRLSFGPHGSLMSQVVFFIALAIALTWLAAGILTCRKLLSGLYLVLGMSCLCGAWVIFNMASPVGYDPVKGTYRLSVLLLLIVLSGKALKLAFARTKTPPEYRPWL